MQPDKILKDFVQYFFGCLFVFSCLPCFAQNGTFSGIVLDDVSSERIGGAAIFLKDDRSSGTVSSDDGTFMLSLHAGNQKLICSYVGYLADTFTVNITAATTISDTIRLSRNARELNMIVVSAGKYEQDLRDITVSMEVLKPQLIEGKNTTNITQALEQVPGLNILDEEPQIRGGSGFAFGVGSRVATLIDGIPVLRGDIGKPDWSFIPLENLDQVEVIKGASSVLYGSSALSGVINFFTRYPSHPFETSVRLYSGLYSAPAFRDAKWWNGVANFSGLNISQGWKTKHTDLIIGGQLLYDHGFIGPPLPNPNISFEQDTLTENDVANKDGRLNFNLRFRPGHLEGLSFGMNVNLMRQQSNFSLIWGNDSSQFYRAFPGTMTLTDNFEYYIDPFITYYSKSGWHQTMKSRFYSDLNVTPGEQRTFSNVIYSEYQLQKALSFIRELHLTVGALLNDSHTKDDLYSSNGTIINNFYNYAAYIQIDKKFMRILNLSAGFREEYFSINRNESTLKPIFRAGMNLRLSQGTFFRLSYGQGFRYPTIAEKFIRTTVGGLIVYPNPDLQPETSWNSEAGIRQLFRTGKWSGIADIAVFWQQFTNTIEYNYALWSPDSAGFKFVNVGRTRVKGLDFSLQGEGNIFQKIGLNVLLGYTYTLPQSMDPHFIYATENPGEGFIAKDLSYIATSSDTSNYILKYRFQHLAKADIEITFKSFAVGVSERYYSFMQNIDKTFYDIDLSGTLPTGIINYRDQHHNGTLITDARISYAFKKHYKAAVVISNLFNTEYSLRPLKADPMRTVALQLKADF